MGQKIDRAFYEAEPELLEARTPPPASQHAMEIYDFIKDNPYTINRGVGMGTDVIVGADMSRLIPVAKEAGIDIYTYKDYCNLFVNLQREEENKQRKKQEKK